MPTDLKRIWRHRSGEFVLGERTLVMGIVNITPDSFSDGGKFFDSQAAVTHALKLANDGADILDFGAESTRPGSEPVAASEQLRRLLPVIAAVAAQTKIPLSVDTTLAVVAVQAIDAGASIVNDVSALNADAEMRGICAQKKTGVVLMHMRGTPATMQRETHYNNLIGEVRDYLTDAVTAARGAGIPTGNILVDPGIGFGKTFVQNYELIAALREFSGLGAGVLAGPSRKAFTAEFSHKPANERQFGTAAAAVLCVMNGADVVRVHDVAEMKEVISIADRFREFHERTR